MTLHVHAPRFRPRRLPCSHTSEELPPIKMTNQRTKLEQAAPVRTMTPVHTPEQSCVHKYSRLTRRLHSCVASACVPHVMPLAKHLNIYAA